MSKLGKKLIASAHEGVVIAHSKRKIIHIATAGDLDVYCVCADGTAWKLVSPQPFNFGKPLDITKATWVQLPVIPMAGFE